MNKEAIEASLATLDVLLIVFGVLVAIGVAGESVFGFMHWRRSRQLDAIVRVDDQNHQSELARLNKKAEDAKLARVKLEQQAAVRDLTIKEQSDLSEKLSGFSGQRAVIDVFPVTFESSVIASQVMGVLINAGWDVPGVTYLPTPAEMYLSNNPRTRPAPLLIMGIMIRGTDDARSQTAAKALFDVMALPATSGMMVPGPLPNPEDPRVWIYVGDKPTPLRSWLK